MSEKDQLKTFLSVLRHFQTAGILKEMMLIGSWCLYFYRHEFEHPKSIPAVHTLDADFLIPSLRGVNAEADVPSILASLGFAPTFNRSNNLTVYDHPGLRVEFLVPETGRGFQKPQLIKQLCVKAQALRYLNFLSEYPKIIVYEDLQLCTPEPVVFALHKLIVSSRRSKKDKRDRDIEAAMGLLDFLYGKPKEVARLKSVMRTMPAKWRKSVLKISEKTYPRLNETADGL
jgi:hypothetical protein